MTKSTECKLGLVPGLCGRKRVDVETGLAWGTGWLVASAAAGDRSQLAHLAYKLCLYFTPKVPL